SHYPCDQNHFDQLRSFAAHKTSGLCELSFGAPSKSRKPGSSVRSDMFIATSFMTTRQAPLGAACFCVGPGRGLRTHQSTSNLCRSYGAWPNFEAVLAINMALLAELGMRARGLALL